MARKAENSQPGSHISAEARIMIAVAAIVMVAAILVTRGLGM